MKPLTLLQRVAVVFPLSLLALTVGTLVVIACNTDIDKPAPEAIILPCAAPKSLIVWMEYDLTANEQAAYAFTPPYKDPPSKAVRFYAGRVGRENLIAERASAGTLRWGPMALDTPYEVVWRGLGEIHVTVPEATEEQIAKWKAEIKRCAPGEVVRLK